MVEQLLFDHNIKVEARAMSNDKHKPNLISGSTLTIPGKFNSLPTLLATILLLLVASFTIESRRWMDDQKTQKSRAKSISNCNLFSGRWVYDNKSYPLYKENHCSFVSLFNGVACEKAGRMDIKYQYWRWQPNGCELPRFNAIAMLERLRGKRLVFVGDSLIRNQWASMVCLLESSISPALKSVTPNGSLTNFKINEYNASVDHYWAPYLVESISDHPVHHHFSDEQVLRANAIESHARHWTTADILVFNSYMWWRRPKFKVLWGSFDSPNRIYKEVEKLRTFEMVLTTWSDWLEIHVNRSKTQIYFLSMSPTHERGERWGKGKGENCYNETEPFTEEGHHESETEPKMMRMVEAAINKMARRGLKVHILNITQLSEYRKDAHTSIYRRLWGRLSREQLANPISYADCVHWCIPGVPDVWNELLYAYIFQQSSLK